MDKPDPVGAGGTTTTGNIAQNLLFDPAKHQVLVECVPKKSRKMEGVIGTFLMSLSVILKAVSSRRNVNIEELDHLCKETSLLIVTHWPTFRFTPSMHQILAHSAALIDANDSTGLGVCSEEPLEHNNKNLRKYRRAWQKNFSECQSFRCFDKSVD